MASKSITGSFLDLDVDSDGRSVFKFFKELDKRGKAYARMIPYALATDLMDLVKSKLIGSKYKDISKNLTVAAGPDNTFAVTFKNRNQKIKKTDAPVTLIYIKAKRVQDRVKPEIKILQDYGPWTVDTIPFWPSKQQAIITQRKVDKRTVDKIGKAKSDIKDKVNRELTKLGQKEVNSAMSRRTSDMR